MVDIIICDDVLEIRDFVESIVKKAFSNDIFYNIYSFSKYDKSFKDLVNTSDIHRKIYILDIEIKDSIDGLTIGREIRKDDYKSVIIYLTSHGELSFEVFKYQLQVLDFITKDEYFKPRLIKVLKSAYKILFNNALDDDVLNLEINNKIFKLAYDEIIYVETLQMDRKLRIVTTSKRLEIKDTLKNISNKLDDRFCYSHKACIVNIDKIQEINTDYEEPYLLLENGSKCMLSKRKIKEIKRYVKDIN